MTDKMLKFVKIGQQTPPKRRVDNRKDDFNDSSLKESLTETSVLRYMRILGPSTNSNFYQILSISAMANGNYKINIKGMFKDDMDFTSTTNQWPLIPDLKLEITRKKLDQNIFFWEKKIFNKLI